jgi:hypothetical protein
MVAVLWDALPAREGPLHVAAPCIQREALLLLLFFLQVVVLLLTTCRHVLRVL